MAILVVAHLVQPDGVAVADEGDRRIRPEETDLLRPDQADALLPLLDRRGVEPALPPRPHPHHPRLVADRLRYVARRVHVRRRHEQLQLAVAHEVRRPVRAVDLAEVRERLDDEHEMRAGRADRGDRASHLLHLPERGELVEQEQHVERVGLGAVGLLQKREHLLEHEPDQRRQHAQVLLAHADEDRPRVRAKARDLEVGGGRGIPHVRIRPEPQAAVEEHGHVAAEHLLRQAAEAVEDRPGLARGRRLREAGEQVRRGAGLGQQVVDRGDRRGLVLQRDHRRRREDLPRAFDPGFRAPPPGLDEAVGEPERFRVAPPLRRRRELVERIVAVAAPVLRVWGEPEHVVAKLLAATRGLLVILPLHVEHHGRPRVGKERRDHDPDPLPCPGRRHDQRMDDLRRTQIGAPRRRRPELAPDWPADLRQLPGQQAGAVKLARRRPFCRAIGGRPGFAEQGHPAQHGGDHHPEADEPADLHDLSAGPGEQQPRPGQQVDLAEVALQPHRDIDPGGKEARQCADEEPEPAAEQHVRDAAAHHRLRSSSSRIRRGAGRTSGGSISSRRTAGRSGSSAARRATGRSGSISRSRAPASR